MKNLGKPGSDLAGLARHVGWLTLAHRIQQVMKSRGLEDDCFLVGSRLFSGAFAVSFKECKLVSGMKSSASFITKKFYV